MSTLYTGILKLMGLEMLGSIMVPVSYVMVAPEVGLDAILLALPYL